MLLATVFYLAVSRAREIDADRGITELVGSGPPLVSMIGHIEGLAT